MKKNSIKLRDLLDVLDPDKKISINHEFEGQQGMHNLYFGSVKYFHEETDAKHYEGYEVKYVDFSASQRYYTVRI